jgi:2-polyprenyl-3-methyl-5-hydroxy-6-metoxy-1,4-benzoquinol methylase
MANKTNHEVDEISRIYSRYLKGQNKNSKILDIGCGNGKVLLFLKESGFNNTFGIDISDEAIKLCRSLGLKNVLHIDAKEFLSKNKESYDIVFALDFLEHLDLKSASIVLEMIHNSLNPGGLLLLQTPNGGSPFGQTYFADDISHKFLLSEKSARQLLNLAGFKNIQIMALRPNYKFGLKRTIRCIFYTTIEIIMLFTYLFIVGEKRILTPNIIVIGYKE